ncbi:hypothetical protein [Sphingobacterium faecium]|uniref:hypothetical protein n=1 Tax=Sphingobacterium faecium TaxID=34087 RepID=UPI003209AEB6
MRIILIFFCCILWLGKVAIAQQHVTVNVIKVDSTFDKESASRLEFATTELERVFNSDAFHQAVLREKFTVGNYNLTSAEIYELIVSGMDNYKDKPKDYSIDLRVSVFPNYQGHGNYGITDMNTRITRTHRCFILNNDVKCYIGHLAHEYMHQIGFYDERTWVLLGKKTSSVPYRIGNIVNKLIGNDDACPAINKTCN